MATLIEDTIQVESDEEKTSADNLTDEDAEDHSGDTPTFSWSGHVVQRSEIQRERSVKINKAPEKRRRQQRKRGENNLKNVSAHTRITQFAGNYFETRSGRLFCGCCSEYLSTKLTTLKTHVRTKKHEAGNRQRASDKKEKWLSVMP